MRNRARVLSLFPAALLWCGLVHAQASGIFTESNDIGVTQKGSAQYDPANHSYRITGGGDDLWGARDAFHFSSLRLSGDAVVTAEVEFPAGGAATPNEKAVLMFRQSLDPGSAYADVAVR